MEISDVLTAWSLTDCSISPISIGLINRTYRVDASGGTFILQWLNPIFGPEVHLDIAAITAHLTGAGVLTPRLMATRTDDLWTQDTAGGVWRLLSFIPGETHAHADSPSRCREAGLFLGRFHRALWDLEHTFHFGRLGVHDTPKHLLTLEEAVRTHRGHAAYDAVAPVAESILNIAGALALEAPFPKRIVHGDPKISNFIFSPEGEARCLVDLDTLAHMALPMELGDAFRSWCSAGGEEVEAAFRLDYFEAGLAGYAESIGCLPTGAEWQAIGEWIEIISTELAARFCADALNETYFGWDAERYPSASAHNLARARSQLALSRSIRDQSAEIARVVGGLRPR